MPLPPGAGPSRPKENGHNFDYNWKLWLLSETEPCHSGMKAVLQLEAAVDLILKVIREVLGLHITAGPGRTAPRSTS